ncbi:MAG: Ldh family oxidoreductase [Planctomycetes bacterium]|nr:Ldh family oxidoreductase [Planctomycetota bacterium]
MMNFRSEELRELTRAIFAAAGAQPEETTVVAQALVDANLAGHDSHGVLRIPEYVRWMEQKWIVPGAPIRVVRETPALAVLDGGWGFGQVVGRKAMAVAMAKAEAAGVGVASVSQCCHIGRVGDYPRIAADRGMAAILFVNTHGGGKLVAPWGGRERRLSANPISIAVPGRGGPPLVLDISTSAIAEGKVRNLMYRGGRLPEGCLLDASGQPSTRPADLYGPPPGALLPFGGHKGFGLGFMTDILAGALSGAGCSRPETDRVGNSFLAIVLDVRQFRELSAFEEDVRRFVDYVKNCPPAPGCEEILIPGEPEAREQARRQREGISLPEETWRLIAETAGRYEVQVPQGLW